MNIIQNNRTASNFTTGVMSFIIPQNGVLDGEVRYRPRASSPQVAMASSKDSHNGNVEHGDTPKRPKMLGVTPPKPYASKNQRKDSEDINEGSLPCTPESESDESSSSAECEALESDTQELIIRFLEEFTGFRKPQWTESKALSTMKRVVDGLLEKHKFAYNGMINKLSMEDRGSDLSYVGAVTKSLFSDGTTNWGRIASLVAFGAVVSQYMKDKGRGNCVKLVGKEISTYLVAEQREWLIKNKSWEGFVEFFRESDPESTVRNTLMACVGVAGIGATLALLIR